MGEKYWRMESKGWPPLVYSFRVVRGSALEAVDSGLISSRVKPVT